MMDGWQGGKVHMGVEPKIGAPKWMVKIMENPIKMDDLGGPTRIFGNTHMDVFLSETPSLKLTVRP